MNKKSLVFWIAICCGLIGVVQTLCDKFGVDLPTNVLIDCVSIVLCVLCCFGILKNDTGHSESEIKDIIVDNLTVQNDEDEQSLEKETMDNDIKDDAKKPLAKDNEDSAMDKKKSKKSATSKALKNSKQLLESKEEVKNKEDR